MRVTLRGGLFPRLSGVTSKPWAPALSSRVPPPAFSLAALLMWGVEEEAELPVGKDDSSPVYLARCHTAR